MNHNFLCCQPSSKQASPSTFWRYRPVESLIHYSFSQGCFCTKVESGPRLNISAAIYFPFMTKAEPQWLASLHHGYQTDGSSGCLNAKYPGGGQLGRGKKPHLNTHFISEEPNTQKRLSQTFPPAFLSLITALQLANVGLRRYYLIGRDFIYASGGLLSCLFTNTRMSFLFFFNCLYKLSPLFDFLFLILLL